MYLVETLVNNTKGASMFGGQALGALGIAPGPMGGGRDDDTVDDDVVPLSVRGIEMSWDPTTPPPSTFTVPSYCTCKQAAAWW